MRNRATTQLTRPKIRQSWSKWNLYNLQRLRDPQTKNRTFFQQKWTAKSMARGYHGEQIRESQWERMFNRRVRSVIPMNARQLALDDGSGSAAGRGSGLEPTSNQAARESKGTPYTAMTFAPLERRLDVAIFRALFASSARQARQFVVHGAVTVNGKKMRYPGYLLNPGDMFQVDPERVMFATGAPKNKFDRREARLEKKKAEEEAAKQAEAEQEAAEESKEGEAEAEAKEPEPLDTRKTLQQMISQAKNIMADNKDVLAGKRKQELRGFQKAVRRVMSRSNNTSQLLTDNLEAQFSEILSLLNAKQASKKDRKDTKKTDSEAASESKDAEGAEATETAATEATKNAEATEPAKAAEGAVPAADEPKPSEALTEAFRQAAQNPEEKVDTSELTDEEVEVLKRALVQMRDNPVDSSKPYATPWRPRDYMNAFAFIPRYLEVNQNICAAVYVRHPVARPGFSEVPTPFGEEVSTGAYHWYLRRR